MSTNSIRSLINFCNSVSRTARAEKKVAKSFPALAEVLHYRRLSIMGVSGARVALKESMVRIGVSPAGMSI